MHLLCQSSLNETQNPNNPLIPWNLKGCHQDSQMTEHSLNRQPRFTDCSRPLPEISPVTEGPNRMAFGRQYYGNRTFLGNVTPDEAKDEIPSTLEEES